MGMITRNNNTLSYTELVHIGGIGFMFEVNKAIKHNLMSPNVLAFFNEVQASEKVTEDCAFPLPISNTNLCQTYFQHFGDDCVICSDGVFRKCPKVKCKIEYKSNIRDVFFMIDRTLTYKTIGGFISL